MSSKYLLTALLSMMAIGLSGGAILYSHAYTVCAGAKGGNACVSIANNAAERWTQLGVNAIALITNVLRQDDPGP